MIEPVSLVTDDGFHLEGEVRRADPERARVALCHPHPLHGGTMQSLVISELFRSLPGAGYTCLRFNFRGVGASEGVHDGGANERSDVRAALQALGVGHHAPCFLVGWSFGADIALSVHDSAVSGWIGIAPPLRFSRDLDVLADDSRPKLLLLAEHDEVRDATGVAAETASWRNTRHEIIPGASHFFVGRTDRLCLLVQAWLTEQLAAEPRTQGRP